MKLLGILLLLVGVFFVYGERKAFLIGKHVDCKEYNKKYFYNITCGMKLINRIRRTYSLHVSLKPVVIDNIRIRMKTYYKFRTEYRPIGVFADEDACAYAKLLNGTKLLSISTFKNLPKELLDTRCPIKGPRSVTINDLEIVQIQLHDFVDIGDWIFESYSYTIVNGKELLLTNVKNYFGIEYSYSKSEHRGKEIDYFKYLY